MNDCLTSEDQRILLEFLAVPEVRQHYICQMGKESAPDRFQPLWLIALALGCSIQSVHQTEERAMRKIKLGLINYLTKTTDNEKGN